MSAFTRKTPRPWRMCRTCHRTGTRTLHGVDRCPAHSLEGVGACGQCGKKRPLVTCHRYDFRGLQRGGTIPRTTRIRKVNPERQAKRKVRQAAKHRAYLRSETRKIVDARAAGRCEAVVWTYTDGSIRVLAPAWDDARLGIRLHEDDVLDRCENMATAHHHRTYFRYGGDELPEDMLKVCKRCHDWLERQDHPTRQSHLRQTGRARQETDRNG